MLKSAANLFLPIMYGAGLRLLRFFFLKRIFALIVLLREQLFHGL